MFFDDEPMGGGTDGGATPTPTPADEEETGGGEGGSGESM